MARAPRFDDYALYLARKALREQGERDHDEADLPYDAEGWSSRWRSTWEPPKVKVKVLTVSPGPPPPVP